MGLFSTVVLALLLSFGVQQKSNQQEPDPFVGHFRHADFEIVLEASESFYRGWLSVRGARYELTARKVGDKLEGTFMADGGRFSFTAEPEENGLTLWLPISRTASEARRSFGQWRKIRYRARRVRPELDGAVDDLRVGKRLRATDTSRRHTFGDLNILLTSL